MLVLIGILFATSSLFAQDAKVNDHKENLTGPFNSPQEVTKACLECHEEAGDEIIASRHWNWAEAEGSVPAGKVNLGKKNIINNFCIAVPSNYPRCTSCHIGYGWKDASFDFSKKVLGENGTFIAKVFAGGTDNTLLIELKKHFRSVRHFKPPASRSESKETYLVAQGFIAK